MNYTKEEKLKLVKLYLDGTIEYPPNSTSQQRNNIRKKIRKWVGVYKAQGEVGLEPRTRSFSFEDKKYAVQRILAGESQYQVAFSMGTTETKSIRKWIRQYRESGWAGLKDGNAQKYFNIKKSTKTKLKEAEEEIISLRSKLRELDIEVEYLKKLIALVNQRRDQQI